MSFFSVWEKQQPSGLPTGFSRDIVPDVIKSMNTFGSIDRISSEVFGARISFVFSGDADVDALVIK